ncbi:MAG TPA: helix-turn-helix transcriptional regulator [Candidatus Limnocylindrales bacterium]
MAKSSNTFLLSEARLEQIRCRLGHEIRERRRAAGLTQAELGRPLTRAYVGMLEAGLALPSLPTLIVLAERLGITPEELIHSVNRS